MSTHEDQTSDIVFSRVASALKAVDGEHVDSQLDSALGVSDGRALVDNVDASSLVQFDDGHGSWSTSRLDHLDTLVNDDLRVLRIGRRRNRGEEREVDGEGLGGELAGLPDALPELLRRSGRETGEDTESSSVRDGGNQARESDPHLSETAPVSALVS